MLLGGVLLAIAPVFWRSGKLNVLRSWFPILVLGEFADEPVYSVPDALQVSMPNDATCGVIGGELQAPQRDLVVIGR